MDENSNISVEGGRHSRDVQSLIRVSGSITESFSKMKFISLSCIIGLFVTAVACVVYGISSVNKLNSTIYVLDKGQAFSASRQDVTISRIDEVKAQSERFHTLFFTATPSREILQRNLEDAMYLCADRSVYTYYNDIQESGFYRRIAQTNSIQEVVVDSVVVSSKGYPYSVVTYSSLYITRPTLIVKNRLVTRMNMIDAPRDRRNMNGLKIENFEVPVNEEVERRKR